MERTILIEPLQKRFTVGVKNANKEARNRSYSQASDCCGKALKQDKRCSACGELSPYKTQRKIVKIGKEEHLIDAQALAEVQDILEAENEIVLHAFMDALPDGAEDRFDSLSYVVPVLKREAQYAELAEVLKGKVAIGKAVFNGNEYQIIVTVGDDGIVRVRKLIEESQRYDFSPLDVQESLSGVALNSEIVQLEKQIIEKKMVQDYNVKEFKDARSEYEEQVIEDFVLNGKVPQVAVQVQEQKEQGELERLRLLAEAR